MILGIREGKLFKGRLNISRMNILEATVKVDGLNDDVLVLGSKYQNRGLNADIVCLQILPEKDWVQNFKESEPINIVDEQVIPQGIGENDAILQKEDQGSMALAEAEEQAHQSKIKITMM